MEAIGQPKKNMQNHKHLNPTYHKIYIQFEKIILLFIKHFIRIMNIYYFYYLGTYYRKTQYIKTNILYKQVR